VYVVPGTHTVEIRSNERRTSKQVVVGGGQSASVSLSLRAEATPAPVEGATEEPAPSESAEGSAQTEVSTSERQNFFEWFADTPVAWVGAGVAVAGLATGGVFAGLATRDYNTADNFKTRLDKEYALDIAAAPELAAYSACRMPTADQVDTPEAKKARSNTQRNASYDKFCAGFLDAANSGDSNRTVAIVATAVGGAALIGTVVYYFIDGEEKPATAATPRSFRARLVPGAGSTFSGLSVVGQF
jgi:hypothetical protein